MVANPSCRVAAKHFANDQSDGIKTRCRVLQAWTIGIICPAQIMVKKSQAQFVVIATPYVRSLVGQSLACLPVEKPNIWNKKRHRTQCLQYMYCFVVCFLHRWSLGYWQETVIDVYRLPSKFLNAPTPHLSNFGKNGDKQKASANRGKQNAIL